MGARPDMSAYFEALAKQRRLCPECLCRPTSIEPSEDPDYAYETCACGYIRTLRSPTAARGKAAGAKPPSYDEGARIVRFPEVKEGGKS